MTLELIDSHCHLDVDRFAGEVDDVLARARAAGLVHLVTVGAGRGEHGPARAVELAAAHPGFVSATAGIHPHDARFADDARLLELEAWVRRPEVVAVGETGLDFHYDLSPRADQERAFRAQVGIARAAGKPIVVHTRLAPDETLRVLVEEGARDVGGVIHCFSEDLAFARRALELGFVSSFSGLVTFPRAEAVREAARELPLDGVLIETDSPFLAPVPHRGKRNEPAYVARVAEFIAAERGLDPEEFASATVRNVRRLFRLP